MIVVPDDEVFTKESTNQTFPEATIEDAPLAFDPPPAYTASAAASNSSTSRGPPSSAFRNKPSNYISLNRTNDSIKGKFVIDPFITVPRSLLPQLDRDETDENRKNLKLDSRNGSIDADITLLSGTESVGLEEAKRKKRTALDIRSANGYINAKLRTHAISASGILVPFYLYANGRNGSVTIGLPRTFEGLLTIYAKNGSIKLSDEIYERLSMFNEDNHTQRCFVGDLASFTGHDWKGNEVDIEATNGRVKIFLVDQVEPETSKAKGGLFSRVWGKTF
jgi:hypothetical protein